MTCDIARFGYNGATVCILIHLGLQSAPPFPVITKKKYFESRILHILLTSEIQNADVGLI